MRELSGRFKVIEIDRGKEQSECSAETRASGTSTSPGPLSDATVPSLTIHGIKFYPGDELHFKGGMLEHARLIGEHVIAGNTFSADCGQIDVRFDGEERIGQVSFSHSLRVNGVRFKPGYLYLFPTGHIANGQLEESAEFQGISLGPGELFFYPDGRLKYGMLFRPQCIQGFNLDANSPVFFFQSGRLDTGTLVGEQTIGANLLYDGGLSCSGSFSLHENAVPHVLKLATDQLGERAGKLLHFDAAGHMTGAPPPHCWIRLGRSINISAVLREPHCENKTAPPVQDGFKNPAPIQSQAWIILTERPDDKPNLLRSQNSSTPTKFDVKNSTKDRVTVYWRDFAGNRVQYMNLPPGASVLQQQTFASHAWEIVNSSGKTILWFVAGPAPGEVVDLGKLLKKASELK